MPVLLVACAKGKDAPRRAPADAHAAIVAVDAAAAAVPSTSYPDLGAALKAIVPADARVIGFGELHQRTDRVQVKSSLAHFTNEAIPALGDQLSDLIIETWLVDPKCGQPAKTATAKVEATVKRPQETKSEIGQLADAARAKQIQPHAMRMKCEDYEKVAPQTGDVKTEVMLGLITAELGRIAEEAVVHRDNEKNPRKLIAIYGGMVHNDRFPAAGIEDLSYAPRVDKRTNNHFIEVDLIVPELAEADPNFQKQPWFPLVKSAGQQVQVWKRGERSFVVIYPRSK